MTLFEHSTIFISDGEDAAGKIYTKLEDFLFTNCSIGKVSVFRWRIPNEETRWYITLVGDPLPQQLQIQVQALLKPYQPITLPPAILQQFIDLVGERRREGFSTGKTWIERHYSPTAAATRNAQKKRKHRRKR